MMDTLRTMIWMLLALCCIGCSSTPPTEYYLLSADARPPVATGHDGPSLGLVGLRVAEYLQRAEILTLASANRLRLHQYARWAEPLQDGIERTLLLDLAALLDSQRVRARPWPREWVPEWRLSVDIARLDVRDSGAVLVANWSLRHGDDVIERNARLVHQRSGDGPEAVAADFSALLLALAEQIAGAMREH